MSASVTRAPAGSASSRARRAASLIEPEATWPRQTHPRAGLGLSRLPTAVRAQGPGARVLARDDDRGVLLDRAAVRAAHLRSDHGGSRRTGRPDPRGARLGRHLPEAGAGVQRAPADDEVGDRLVRPAP